MAKAGSVPFTPKTDYANKVLHVYSGTDAAVGGVCWNWSAVNSGALLHGAGTSGTPVTTATASKNFLSYYCKSTATDAGSDTRAQYIRLYLSGATTGGGDCLRAFTTVEAAIGTARGTHSSLSFGSAGFVSGLGTALTGTLHIPNTGTMTGTMAALEAQIYCDTGSADDVTIPASHGLIRMSVAGDTGNDDKILNAFHFDLSAGCIAAAGSSLAKMVTTGTAVPTVNTAIKININGTDYWLCATTAIAAP